MDEDSDTRSSFPSPFKKDSATTTENETPKEHEFPFRKHLNWGTNAPFHSEGML